MHTSVITYLFNSITYYLLSVCKNHFSFLFRTTPQADQALAEQKCNLKFYFSTLTVFQNLKFQDIKFKKGRSPCLISCDIPTYNKIF